MIASTMSEITRGAVRSPVIKIRQHVGALGPIKQVLLASLPRAEERDMLARAYRRERKAHAHQSFLAHFRPSTPGVGRWYKNPGCWA
ncbi:hypothetical protein PSPO01_01855 [Paraphaeosphaeria sporulosa]